MTRYRVMLAIQGGCTTIVEAETPDDAVDQAMESLDMGDWDGDVTPEGVEEAR